MINENTKKNNDGLKVLLSYRNFPLIAVEKIC